MRLRARTAHGLRAESVERGHARRELTGMSLARVLSMSLPFSAGQFFDVLAEYNLATSPAQVVWMVAALAGVSALFVRGPWDRALGWLLAALWSWMAVAYHFAFF